MTFYAFCFLSTNISPRFKSIIKKKSYCCLADRSVSSRHSRTSILAWTMPRFSRSAELRLPEYVGRMSRPISSMTINSCAYLDKLELLGKWFKLFTGVTSAAEEEFWLAVGDAAATATAMEVVVKFWAWNCCCCCCC